MTLFSEIHYWERLKFEIPHCISDIYQHRDELRVLKENVLLLVRDYNRFGTYTLNALNTVFTTECKQVVQYLSIICCLDNTDYVKHDVLLYCKHKNYLNL